MAIDTKTMVSISEANHNFSKVARMVEENGELVISKNNKPAYVISKYDQQALTENDYVELVARRILSEHKYAFEELAKE